MNVSVGVIFNSNKPWFSASFDWDEYGLDADIVIFKFIFFICVWRSDA